MEKIYKMMGNAGAGNIALGIVMIVAGVAAGVLAIVNGARLLSGRKHITF